MHPGKYLSHIGVFVSITALVIGGAVLGGMTQSAPSPDFGQPAPEQFRANDTLATVNPENGTLSIDADITGKLVVIDRSHGNRFAQEDLDVLVTTLVENGHVVRFHESDDRSGRNLLTTLKPADAFVIVNPTEQFTDEEVGVTNTFAKSGGRVLILGDPASTRLGLFGGSEAITHNPTALGSQFGIAVGTGYLYNMGENANNYQHIYATPATTDEELTDGIDRVVFHESAPIRTSQGERLLIASNGTRLSTTRNSGDYAVVVRNGNVVGVGDTSFFTPSAAYDADNEVLVGNLIEFLITGSTPDSIEGRMNRTQLTNEGN